MIEPTLKAPPLRNTVPTQPIASFPPTVEQRLELIFKKVERESLEDLTYRILNGCDLQEDSSRRNGVKIIYPLPN